MLWSGEVAGQLLANGCLLAGGCLLALLVKPAKRLGGKAGKT